ncbi:hypothetical protein EDC17_101157 [Sphingobacterium alimentarium]|uniref:Uncharacterized protein n=1 Tax=Sphingobacterium alimentarium TaxID=797292 RepID=A0A4R3W049_9SPHI|nr:hypothetical protein [Sphingobacterium alimentarium]TCV17140.1 hypothetical protein EDC17_101157 [Sphingobacterium alimentarium]
MERTFFAFRYLITKNSSQYDLFGEEINKEQLVKEVLNNLKEAKKITWDNSDSKYIFTGIDTYENLYFLKFARESNNFINEEVENDIVRRGITEPKFVYLIIDQIHQIVLIESNKSVFANTLTVSKLLKYYLNEKINSKSYIINIFPLATPDKFWNVVNNAELIYDIKLELNAPNMAFFGKKKAQQILKIIHNETNNDELDISFKNSKGELNVDENGLGKFIDYIREVGGQYMMKFKIIANEKFRYFKSSDDKFSTNLDISDNFSSTESKEYVKDKIEKISTLKTRE